MLHLVYSSTPKSDRGLRDLFAEHLAMEKDLNLTKGWFRRALKDVPGLAVDILKYLTYKEKKRVEKND